MDTVQNSVAEDGAKVLEALSPSAVSAALDQIWPWLLSLGGKLLIALLIFLVGKRIIAILRKMVNRSIEKAGLETGIAKFIKSLTDFFLHAFLLFIIAAHLGLNITSLLAVLGTAGLALGLALQNTLANFAGGVLILVMKPYKVGDYIICQEGEGTVSVIGLVYTTLMTVDNRAITIPNGTLSNMTVTNATAMDKRRLDLTVSIGYQADLKKAKELLEQLLRGHPSILKEEDINVFVDRLGNSSVVIGARGWVPSAEYWKTKWDLTEKIKLLFDESGIEITVNQMDIRLI